jgi:ssRNA-specific RNase YbeY (16S rRNA maturation enzyme)
MTIVGVSESLASNINRLLYKTDKKTDLVSFTFPGLSNKQAEALAAMG